MNQKGFTLILILAAVAVTSLIAGGAYYFTKVKPVQDINSFEDCAKAGFPIMESYPGQCRTPDGRTFTQVLILTEKEKEKLIPPDETVNWKTYTNTKYNYSLQYPSSWIDSGNQEGDWFNDQYFASSKKEGLYSHDVEIRIIKSVAPQWSSVKDYFDKEVKNKQSVSGLKAKITKLDSIAVGGEEGIRQVVEMMPGSGTEYYYSDNIYVYKNGYVYTITSSGPDKQSVDKNKKVFDQILSTFKFTI